MDVSKSGRVWCGLLRCSFGGEAVDEVLIAAREGILIVKF